MPMLEPDLFGEGADTLSQHGTVRNSRGEAEDQGEAFEHIGNMSTRRPDFNAPGR